MTADPNLQNDLNHIIDGCTGVGDVLDELTLLRTSLRLYGDGHDPEDAVAVACDMLSDAITKRSKP